MRVHRLRWWSWIAVFGAVAAAAPVGAVDGVIEINQASIMAAGGYPHVISAAGSYRLTSNLTSSADAMQAIVAGVHIDLNGFEVVGPGSCTATLSGDYLSGVSCTGNAGIGIFGASVVTNGRVRGFQRGIVAATDRPIRVRGVEVTQNSVHGFEATTTSYQFLDSSATVNGANGVNGFGDLGIGVIDRSVFSRNEDYGAYVGSGTVSRSASYQNFQGVRSNNGRGCLVADSVFERNDTGFFGSVDSGYQGNLFRDQQTQNVSANLGGNQCDSVVCP